MTDTVEVVIKLDKADLEAVRSMGLNRTQEAVRKRVDSAIQHGTVLPKGHGRLIDESAILDAIDVAIHFANKEGHEYANAFENNGRWCAEYNSIENMIASAPTIIEADKSCSTCKYSDEVDGSNCYECVKGMKNNYKADSEVE